MSCSSGCAKARASCPPGDPLLEIGDPTELEIVADLLSTDAVRVRPGARAMIEEWGGHKALDARVRRVEPAGFTKISALGVEEQRVNVILDFTDPADAWAALGDAYRVEVRIVEWEAPNVLKVPTSALFREGSEWAVYVVDNGHVRRTSRTWSSDRSGGRGERRTLGGGPRGAPSWGYAD